VPISGGSWVAKRDQVNLACVLWAAAARLVGATEGRVRAAEELNHSAEVAEDNSHQELAVALWREALTLDPNNLETANRLGQRLHHLAVRHDDIERYREAEHLLARVTFVDNHAKLFHGWSALRIGDADNAVDQRDRALAEIDEALKAWAFGQRQVSERSRWVRQVRRLAEAGYTGQAEALIDFANRNARWGSLGTDELRRSPGPKQPGRGSAASEVG
jgi:tetratricopeptide (TPR) repeat protein